MLFYVTCQKHDKITYFCFLYFPRLLPSLSLKWNHNNVLPWGAGPGGRRVSFELCPFLASCVMGNTENRAASTHGCAVEHDVAPKSLKGFGHLSVMLKGKKKTNQTLKKKIPNHNRATTLDIYKTYVLLTCRKDWWNGTTAFLKWHSTNNYLKCCWCRRISLKSPWPEIKQSHHWKISQNYVNA